MATAGARLAIVAAAAAAAISAAVAAAPAGCGAAAPAVPPGARPLPPAGRPLALAPACSFAPRNAQPAPAAGDQQPQHQQAEQDQCQARAKEASGRVACAVSGGARHGYGYVLCSGQLPVGVCGMCKHMYAGLAARACAADGLARRRRRPARCRRPCWRRRWPAVWCAADSHAPPWRQEVLPKSGRQERRCRDRASAARTCCLQHPAAAPIPAMRSP